MGRASRCVVSGLVLVAVVGCAGHPAPGDRYVLGKFGATIFHTLDDATRGGPLSRRYDAIVEGRASGLDPETTVEVLEVGPSGWVKVEAWDGRQQWAVGWVESDNLEPRKRLR